LSMQEKRSKLAVKYHKLLI